MPGNDSYADSRSGAPDRTSRALGIEERAARTIALAEGVFTRFDPALSVVRAALAGGPSASPTAASRLARRLATDAGARGRAQALLACHTTGRETLATHARELTQALKISVPHERQSRIFAIPLVLVQSAGSALLAAAEDYRSDPDVGPLLFAKAAAAMVPARMSAAPRPVALGRLEGWAHSVAGRFGLPDAPSVSPEEVRLRRMQGTLAANQTVLEESRAIYTYTAERIAVVEQGVKVHNAPRADPGQVLPGASPKVIEIATALSRLYGQSPPAFQRSQVAISQTHDFRRELYVQEQSIRRVARLPAAQRAVETGAIDLAMLRGKAIPLLNFPHTFAPDPILNKLFPRLAPA